MNAFKNTAKGLYNVGNLNISSLTPGNIKNAFAPSPWYKTAYNNVIQGFQNIPGYAKQAGKWIKNNPGKFGLGMAATVGLPIAGKMAYDYVNQPPMSPEEVAMMQAQQQMGHVDHHGEQKA